MPKKQKRIIAPHVVNVEYPEFHNKGRYNVGLTVCRGSSEEDRKVFGKAILDMISSNDDDAGIELRMSLLSLADNLVRANLTCTQGIEHLSPSAKPVIHSLRKELKEMLDVLDYAEKQIGYAPKLIAKEGERVDNGNRTLVTKRFVFPSNTP